MLWLGVGIPVIGSVLTALALNLLGLGSEPEPAPSGTGEPTGRPSTAPFTVTARQESEAGCTALPRRLSSPADRAELVSGGDVGGVIKRNRGARVGELNVDFTLEGGARSLTIASIDIEPKKLRPSPPLSGTLLCEPNAGGEPKIHLFADMDSPKPVFRTGKDDSTQRYFRDKVITLQPGEQVNLSAKFRAETGSREFGLVIRYVQNGKEAAVPVPAPQGGRYAVTSYAAEYGAAYEGSVGGVFRLLANPRRCRWTPAPKC
ncbi:hypothetical protein [Streptomyces niger]|uniref:hypothetical protein n=1 Tax=Streptomyces niger TaxID=66373 RepID=UPI00069A4401|nr:hypothetical protein [Streptomyces niger]